MITFRQTTESSTPRSSRRKAWSAKGGARSLSPCIKSVYLEVTRIGNPEQCGRTLTPPAAPTPLPKEHRCNSLLPLSKSPTQTRSTVASPRTRRTLLRLLARLEATMKTGVAAPWLTNSKSKSSSPTEAVDPFLTVQLSSHCQPTPSTQTSHLDAARLLTDLDLHGHRPALRTR